MGMKCKPALSFLLFLWLSFAILGCAAQKEPLLPGESAYQIYYLNSSLTKLEQREYRTKTAEPGLLTEELMECFRNVPADLDCQAALTEQVGYLGYRNEDKVLYLYFDTNYTSMKAAREILCRQALVLTLTQVPGVEYVNIYAGDQPLMDRNGMPVGMVSAADFIDSISDVNAYEETELTLYFTDDSGDALIPEKRTVMYNINTSVEQVVLQELIRGPETDGLRPTLDPATRLLNVSVNENICYINFDSAFLANSLEVKEEIPIYSIVNSLSELSTVNRVQFTVNGEQNAVFRDKVPLNAFFERNLDYLKTE